MIFICLYIYLFIRCTQVLYTTPCNINLLYYTRSCELPILDITSVCNCLAFIYIFNSPRLASVVVLIGYNIIANSLKAIRSFRGRNIILIRL